MPPGEGGWPLSSHVALTAASAQHGTARHDTSPCRCTTPIQKRARGSHAAVISHSRDMHHAVGPTMHDSVCTSHVVRTALTSGRLALMFFTAAARLDWYWDSRTTYTILMQVRPLASGTMRRDSGSTLVKPPPAQGGQAGCCPQDAGGGGAEGITPQSPTIITTDPHEVTTGCAGRVNWHMHRSTREKLHGCLRWGVQQGGGCLAMAGPPNAVWSASLLEVWYRAGTLLSICLAGGPISPHWMMNRPASVKKRSHKTVAKAAPQLRSSSTTKQRLATTTPTRIPNNKVLIQVFYSEPSRGRDAPIIPEPMLIFRGSSPSLAVTGPLGPAATIEVTCDVKER